MAPKSAPQGLGLSFIAPVTQDSHITSIGAGHAPADWKGVPVVATMAEKQVKSLPAASTHDREAVE